MRVVAGTVGGRRLRVPPGRTTRPTSDRVREALFSTLGDRAVGARVLDLYAGSGALGIEALSRGAASAMFVEHDRRAAAVLRDNLATLDLVAAVYTSTVAQFVRRAGEDGEPAVYDLVVCDPPYQVSSQTVAQQLSVLAHRCLSPDAIMVVERARHGGAFAVADELLEVTDVRTYGDTVLYYVALRHSEPQGT
ncbi:16S rRNA (guanine(966)-N(2))-methyltransferase RsmD [soil metagenome]